MIRTQPRAARWAAAALLLASAVWAQEAVTLARAPKKGDVARYQFKVTGNVLGADFEVTGIGKDEIADVKENGHTVSVETQESGKLVIMGMEQPQQPEPPRKYTRDRQGKLIDLDPKDGGPVWSPEVLRLMVMLSEPIFSERAVKPGDSWETEFDNPVAAGKKVTVKTTFVASEKVDEVPTHKIHQTAAADVPEGMASVEGTYWVDAGSGLLVKAEAAVKNFPSQFGPMSWTETRQRLKE